MAGIFNAFILGRRRHPNSSDVDGQNPAAVEGSSFILLKSGILPRIATFKASVGLFHWIKPHTPWLPKPVHLHHQKLIY